MKNNKINAGQFSSWLDKTCQTQKTSEGMDVPCGTCTACCTASYFIHIKPQEKVTIARIPKALLFPAPGMPKGHLVLGYDKNGHCPMFKDNKCSIYEDRPQTCRSYDCRVFTATGQFPVDKNRNLVVLQAKRWKFGLNSDEDHKNIMAVRSAARFLKKHADLFPAGFVPRNTTQQAILAIKVYRIFLNRSFPEKTQDIKIEKLVQTVIFEFKKFESQ